MISICFSCYVIYGYIEENKRNYKIYKQRFTVICFSCYVIYGYIEEIKRNYKIYKQRFTVICFISLFNVVSNRIISIL